jgi:menaquinone-specific isochorismate synthase
MSISGVVATTVPLDRRRAHLARLQPRPGDDGGGLPARLPDDGIAWVTGERALVAWGRVASVRPGMGDARFAVAASEVRGLLSGLRIRNEVGGWGTGPLAFGAFSFDGDSPASELVVPATVVGCDGKRAWITTIGAPHAPEIPASLEAPAARRVDDPAAAERWLDAVTAARASVREGSLDKVVLARSVVVEGEGPFSIPLVEATLARRYPQCFTYAFDGLVGASPELLVRRTGPQVESVVLGGSAPRGRTGAEDAALGRRLVASAKDRREHDLALANVREALGRVCAGLDVEARPSLLRLANVQHLCTRVAGSANGRLGALELVGALHPTAATCGVPTDAALTTIRELEGLDRGRYCGSVGWVDGRGDGEWAIALRCAELSGSVARLFAGAGIVADSDPAAELAETELKLRPLLQALGV